MTNEGRFRICIALDATTRAAVTPLDDEICRDPSTGQLYVGVSGAWLEIGGGEAPPLEDFDYTPAVSGHWSDPSLSDPVSALDDAGARITALEDVQSDYVQLGLYEVKADILVAVADSDPARLPVGTNGQVLTADSAETLGRKWATPAGGASSLTVTDLGNVNSATVLTIDGSKGYKCTATGNLSFSFTLSGLTSTTEYRVALYIVQDGTGGRTLTLTGTNVDAPAAVLAVPIAAGAGQKSFVEFRVYNSRVYLVNAVMDLRNT